MICIRLGEAIVNDDGLDINGSAWAFVPNVSLTLDDASKIGECCYVADPWAHSLVQIKQWIANKSNVCLSIMTMNITGHGLRQVVKTVLDHGGSIRILCPPMDFFGTTSTKKKAVAQYVQALEDSGVEVRLLHCSNSQYIKPKAGSIDKPYYSLHVKYFHITSDEGDMVFATTCNANDVADTYVETAIIWQCDSPIKQEQYFFQKHWEFAQNHGAVAPETKQLIPFSDSRTPCGALCSPLCTDNMRDVIDDFRNHIGDNAVAYAGKWAPHGAPKSPGDDWLIKFLRKNGRFYFGSKQARAATNSEFDRAEYSKERICNNIFKIDNLHAKGIAGDNGFIQYSINMVGVGHDYMDVPTKDGLFTRIGEISRLDYLPSPQAGKRMIALLSLLWEQDKSK